MTDPSVAIALQIEVATGVSGSNDIVAVMADVEEEPSFAFVDSESRVDAQMADPQRDLETPATGNDASEDNPFPANDENPSGLMVGTVSDLMTKNPAPRDGMDNSSVTDEALASSSQVEDGHVGEVTEETIPGPFVPGESDDEKPSSTNGDGADSSYALSKAPKESLVATQPVTLDQDSEKHSRATDDGCGANLPTKQDVEETMSAEC